MIYVNRYILEQLPEVVNWRRWRGSTSMTSRRSTDTLTSSGSALTTSDESESETERSDESESETERLDNSETEKKGHTHNKRTNGLKIHTATKQLYKGIETPWQYSEYYATLLLNDCTRALRPHNNK
jgi:hypothetical protein